MSKPIGVITVHGMGDTKNVGEDGFYAEKLLKKVKSSLGKDEFSKIAWGHVFYQDLLQENEERYFQAIRSEVRWDALRKFMIYGFCDAASLESQKYGIASPYFQAQNRILGTFREVSKELAPDAPVFVIAQSLGGQVLSNYLWDAGKTSKQPTAGVWSVMQKFSSEREERVCRGFEIKRIFTTGCNIPLFVAGRDEIVPIDPRRADFEWRNYYDKADVLGYPLRPLSEPYARLVQDHAIRAGWSGGFSPLSHVRYWGDSGFVRPLVNEIRQVIS